MVAAVERGLDDLQAKLGHLDSRPCSGSGQQRVGGEARNGIDFQGVYFLLVTQHKIDSCEVPAAERAEAAQCRRLNFCNQCGVIDGIEEELLWQGIKSLRF